MNQKYKDKFGKGWDTIQQMRWANINYEMMKVLTEEVELVVADAEQLLESIKTDRKFRANLIQYCQVAEIQEITGN